MKKSKKLIFAAVILFLIAVFIFFITPSTTGMAVKEKTIIGYCPTMQSIAEEIASEHNFILKPFGAASEALDALNKGNADVIVIGRTAKSSELKQTAYELRLKQGFTLVGKTKQFIHFAELKNIEIHTYLDKQAVEEFMPYAENIIYHNSIESALNKNQLTLIDWNDYADDFELVIPVYPDMSKVEEFRTPVVYSYDEKII